jgi:hypothetical protein
MVAAIAVAFGFVQITMAIDPVHFIKLWCQAYYFLLLAIQIFREQHL